MHDVSLTRRLVLALMVCGLMAAAPAVASATTTYATVDSLCWLREYPQPATCDSDGYVGTGQLGVGTTSVGDSRSFFNAAWDVPSNAEVCEATLRFDSPDQLYSTIEVGEVTSGFDWYTTTYYTFDVADIATFQSFSPGGSLTPSVDITDQVQAWHANSQSSAFIGFYAPDAIDSGFLYNPEIEIDYGSSC
jgi:hypothetical protein